MDEAGDGLGFFSSSIPTGSEALGTVAQKDGSVNWVFVGPNADGLPLAGCGAGSVYEMRECIREYGDGALLFGLLRLDFGRGIDRRIKYVMVYVCTMGERDAKSVSAMKGVALRDTMKKAFEKFIHVVAIVEVTHAADLTLDTVLAKLKSSVNGDASCINEVAFREALEDFSHAHPELDLDIERIASDAREDVPSDAHPAEVARLLAAAAELSDAQEPPVEVVEKDAPSDTRDESENEGQPLQAQLEVDFGYPTTTTDAAAAQKAPPAPPSKGMRFLFGDMVEVYSASNDQWLQGLVEEVLSCEKQVGGTKLPTGAIRVKYAKGKKFKWVAPDTEPPVLRKLPLQAPAPLQGWMMKETHNYFSSWHERLFEVKSGILMWWETRDGKANGEVPNGTIHLEGLQLSMWREPMPEMSAVFSVRSKTSKRVYNLGIPTGAQPGIDDWKGPQPSIDDWTWALHLHSAFSAKMRHRQRQA